MKTRVLAKGEFDINALKAARQAKTAKVDLVGELAKISPEIATLKVGETAVIEGVVKTDIRKIVMGITAKLSHLTAKGGDWAGKDFDVASDADAGIVYVQRGSNLKPEQIKERKKGGGGGRKKKTAEAPAGNAGEEQSQEQSDDNKADEAAAVVAGSGAVVKEHA
jgi:hypothetical protein